VRVLDILVAVITGLSIIGLYVWLLAIGIIALVRILNRTGYSGWWVLIGFVPVVGVIALSRFSKAKWADTASEPSVQKSASRSV
jgi:hypothetical protein